MELRHLRYFEALADTLHFGRAADRLHISQPALSKQIKELEGELGTQLFFRYKKGIELTEAGKVFLAETLKTLEQAEQAVLKVKQTLAGQTGELKLSYESSSLQPIIVPLVQKYSQSWPNVKVNLQEGCTQTSLDALKQNHVDVAFVCGPLQHLTLPHQVISTQRIYIALPASHALAQNQEVALHELSQEAFLIHPRQENPHLYDLLISLCKENGFAPKIIQEHASQAARLNMVGMGMGVSFALGHMNCHHLPNIVLKPLKESNIMLPLAAVWRRGRTQAHIRHFLDILKEHYNQV